MSFTKVFALWENFKCDSLAIKSMQSASDHDVLWSSHYFHQRSLIILISRGVTFMIYSMLWHCLPIHLFRESALLGLLVDHRGSIYCTVLRFNLTPTCSGLQRCSKRLAESMNNSALSFWVESDTNRCCFVSAFSTQWHVIKSDLSLKSTLSQFTGQEKGQSRLFYLPVIKTMKQRATHFHFLYSGFGWIKKKKKLCHCLWRCSSDNDKNTNILFDGSLLTFCRVS